MYADCDSCIRRFIVVSSVTPRSRSIPRTAAASTGSMAASDPFVRTIAPTKLSGLWNIG